MLLLSGDGFRAHDTDHFVHLLTDASRRDELPFGRSGERYRRPFITPNEFALHNPELMGHAVIFVERRAGLYCQRVRFKETQPIPDIRGSPILNLHLHNVAGGIGRCLSRILPT